MCYRKYGIYISDWYSETQKINEVLYLIYLFFENFVFDY